MSLSSLARVAVSTFGLLFFSLLLPVQHALAQNPPAQSAAPATAPGEIDAMVAPIALYPDALLAKVLIASTYPMDVVEADRFVKANAGLKGAGLEAEANKKSWDENVKSLTATPTVLAMMSERLDWTQKLGDTFLANQTGVTDAVQRLRQKAQANGTLKTSAEQTVTTESDPGATTVNNIIIQPSEPDKVYVPYYDNSVYGPWDYAAYPPYPYYPPAGYGLAAAGIGFIAGAAIAGGWWNSGVGWGGGGVYVDHHSNFNNFNRQSINNINRNRNNIANGNRWNHNAGQRRGVGYGDRGLNQRFGRDSGAGAGNREAFRGRAGADRLANNLGGGQFGLGGNGVANRGGAGIAGNGGFGGGNLGNRGGAGGGSFGNRGGGFDGIGNGASTRNFASRGSNSMRSGGFGGGGGSRMASGGGARSFGGGGGARMGGGGGGFRGGGGGRRR